MKTKEPMAAFAEGMREHNRYSIWNCVLVLLAWGGAGLFYNDSLTGTNIFLIFFLKILLGTVFGIRFHRLYLYTGEQKVYLEHVVRPHYMDVKAFFAYIRKKQILWQGILLVEGLVLALLAQSPVQAVSAVLGACVPTLVSFAEQSDFQYALTHRGSLKRKAGMTVFRGVIGVLELAMYVPTFLFLTLGYVILSGFLADYAGFDNSIIAVRQTQGYGVYVILYALILLVVVELWERFKKYTPVILGLIVVACAGQLGAEHFCYLDITENAIIKSDFSGKITYTFDEVAEYEYVDDQEEPRLEVAFRDGQNMKLSGYAQELYSDAYVEKYEESLNPFFRELVAQFQREGAKDRGTK